MDTNAVKMGEVSEEISQTTQKVEELQVVIDDLFDRLSQVRRGSESIASSDPTGTEKTLVPQAGYIRTIRERIGFAIDRLKDLIETLEV